MLYADMQTLTVSLCVFSLPNMPAYAHLFCGTGRAFTLPEASCLLALAPLFILPDPTHRGGLFCSDGRIAVAFTSTPLGVDVNATAMRFQGGGLGRGVAALSLQQRQQYQRAAIDIAARYQRELITAIST